MLNKPAKGFAPHLIIHDHHHLAPEEITFPTASNFS